MVSALWIGDSSQEHALSPGEATPAGPLPGEGALPLVLILAGEEPQKPKNIQNLL